MQANRREFFQRLTTVSATGALLMTSSNAAESQDFKEFKFTTTDRPLIISTWPFGKPANERGLEILAQGGSLLDAVEKGINVPESDPNNSSVGGAGYPDADGVVQLDACIMDGPTAKAGSVAGIERIRHPISVARRVMEKTPHVMLVGEGARQFAVKEGFEEMESVTPAKFKEWEKWKARQPQAVPGKKDHDTIALVALGADGGMAGGCSTSGLSYKLPGRVGDSPIIGSGLYVDNDVGGAGATGVGENVMRFCGSFLVVEFMRQGLHPTEACVEAIKRIQSKHTPGTNLHINFVAMSKKGEYGAAGTDQGFQFSISSPGFSKVVRALAVTDAKVGSVGGNHYPKNGG